MLFNPKHEDRLGRLANELRFAQAVTPALFSHVIAEACTRLPVLSRAAKAVRIDQLIDAGAWTEAALALIALELPAWKLRRLVFEDGEWICCLTQHPDLPAELDDTAEGCHEILPLAIMCAFLEARCRSAAEQAPGTRSVPQVRPEAACGLCCDNFV
jgi:hypothetical protein